MRYSFVGKDIEVSDAMKDKTIQKLSKLEKFISDDTEVIVTYSVIKLDNKVEVTAHLKKRVLHAEATGPDMYAAIDQVVNILDRQIVRYKERLKSKSRKNNAFKEEFNLSFINDNFDNIEEFNSDDKIEIKKIKRFNIKPMDVEEAIMEMELLNHNFFVFRNADTDEVNVVYKRKDNAYGFIEPEY